MSFPEGVATATLTVSPGFTAMGTSPKVRVSIRPAQQVTHEASGEPLLPFESRTEYGVDPVSVVLPIDDQPGFVDQAGNAVRLWGYRVIVYRKPDGGRDDKVERVVHLLAGQTTVDFDLIPDGESTAPVIGSPGFVTSVNGLTGAVLVGDLPGGDDGKSAYELAADAGFAGTVDEWLESLHGEDGTNGVDGQDGADGISPELPDLSGYAALPAGVTLTVHYNDGWPARPTARTDITVQWAGGAKGDIPPGALTGDLVLPKAVTP